MQVLCRTGFSVILLDHQRSTVLCIVACRRLRFALTVGSESSGQVVAMRNVVLDLRLPDELINLELSK